MVTPAERALLDRAFALAERGRGTTSPNPMVGCVVVGADGTVVGEGWHERPGGPHAEAAALAAAGEAARGGTAIVTLEPCAHHGRTPPCADALIAAGIRRVVIALADPNPVAGGGAERLRAAGVEVVEDVDPDRARRQNAGFLHGIAHGRPLVVWKTATTLDGRIADAHGASQWLTGERTRELAHRLRAEVDAVLVGSGTALADNPRLTIRLPGWTGPQPLRVVLDRRGRVAATPHLHVHDDEAPTLLLDSATPAEALAELHDRGVRSVLIEGGATVAGAFMAARLVDRIVVHLAGLVLGDGLSPLAGLAFTLADAPRFALTDVAACDDDVVVTYSARA